MNPECPTILTQEKMNQEIYMRNIPSQPLQPYLNVRPVMTKYSYLPIVDPRREINQHLIDRPTYNTKTVFNPGTRQAPWSGFASNINLESELRNQIYAAQKCSQSVYVPNSNSDLYEVKFNTTQSNLGDKELLFKEENFHQFNPNPDPKVLGVNLFNNNTRVQLKDISSCN
jgi:hypothetical protein